MILIEEEAVPEGMRVKLLSLVSLTAGWLMLRTLTV
jgi:hypothetical protein